MSFRRGATGTLGTVGVAVGRAAAGTTVSARTATGATPLPAASASTSAAIARRVLDEVFRELGQLGATELSIAVGIKGHGMGDQAVDRGRSTLATATATSSRSSAAGAAWPTRLSGATASSPFATRTAPLFAGHAGTIGATLFLRIASRAFTTASTSFAESARSTLRMQFVLAELSVAVLVEFLERGGRIGNFFGRQLAVVIGIEHFHQRIARRTMSPSAPFRWSLAVIFVLAAGRAFRRLGDNDGGAQGTQHSDDPQRATHKTISNVSRLNACQKGNCH